MKMVFILSLCGLVVAPATQAASYFVATNGLDGNAGTNVSAPFHTIQKAATVMTAGDACFIRGGTYYETVTPVNSGTSGNPIIFQPYNGEVVTISAADVVAGWTSYRNSIYQATVNTDLGAGFNQVFINGAMVNEARYPNTGTNLLNQTLAAGTATASSVTLSSMPSRSDNYWVGGTVYGCFGSRWTSQGATIIASTNVSTNCVLTVSNQTSNWYAGSGNAYLTGIFGELDSAGEWFISGTKLYLWAPGSVNPATVLVQAKARKWCVNLSGKSYVNIRNLNLFAGSIRMDANNCVISGCSVQYLSHFTKYTWGGMDATGDCANGNNGVWISGTANVISNCTFTYSAGSGILVAGSSNVITRCQISEMDYSGTYSCPLSIYGSTGGNLVSFNSIFDAGRDIIQLYGATADQIFYNDLSNAGKICNDLGITYQWGRDGQGTRIAYNWVHENPKGAGIYNDNYCRNFIEDHNVIWNCTGDPGVRLNTPTDAMQIYNNTLFNCNDVGTSTYNAWPHYIPAYWSAGNYGNITNYAATNNLFLGTSPSTQLNGYAASNFTLKTGAAAIDAGGVVSPFTDGYIGSAPDLGAYEYGTPAWKPGVNGWPTVPVIGTFSVSTVASTNIGSTVARLQGLVNFTNATPTQLWFWWGPADGGTNAAAWTNSVLAGTVTAIGPTNFSCVIGNLDTNTTYYYRAYASNTTTAVWASQSTNFTTLLIQQLVLAASASAIVNPVDGSGSSHVSGDIQNINLTNDIIVFNGNLDLGRDGFAAPDARSFLKFDLTAIPSVAIVQAATLSLYLAYTETYGGAALRYITRTNWDTNNIIYGLASDTNSASVINFANTVGSTPPVLGWYQLNVTAIVGNWSSNLWPNYGFALRAVSEGYTLTLRRFASSRDALGFAPQLAVTYILPANVDANTNGLPDEWELLHWPALGVADPNASAASDGWSNRQKYILGFDPLTPASRSLLTVTPTAVSFFGIPATGTGYTGLTRYYTIETTTNFTDSVSWQPIAGYNQIPGNNATNTYSLVFDAQKRFYRLRVQL